MFPTIDGYIDAAKARLGLTSDRQLDLRLGVTAVNYWRRRKSLPAESTMAVLAELAGVDDGAALLDLAIWRAEARHETKAAAAYMRLRDALTKATAAAIVLAALFASPASTMAGTAGEQVASNFGDLYIMRLSL
jgi:hypothetical protein